MRQHGPQHPQGPEHVYVELPLHFGFVDFLDGPQRAVAGVVYHYVEVAQGGDGLLHGPGYAGRIGHVEHDAPAVAAGFPSEFIGLGLVTERGGYFIAFGQQQFGQRFTEAGRGPGDEPVFRSIGHGMILRELK